MADDLIVLIHGLNRTSFSMLPLQLAAQHHGYATRRWGYASRRHSIAQHAERLERELGRLLREHEGEVHFVTHSLGGIIVRAWLRRYSLPNLGRVVMLAPPNRGSEVADAFQRLGLDRLVGGVPCSELGTGPASAPNELPAVDYEVGVVAGDRSFNPLFSRWIGGPNDGKVAVARASVDGMKDFVVVQHGHTFLPMMPVAMAQTFSFLERGHFQQAPLSS
jgi:pimeloyl-ACP methyl ester carboxylesterase